MLSSTKFYWSFTRKEAVCRVLKTHTDKADISHPHPMHTHTWGNKGTRELWVLPCPPRGMGAESSVGLYIVPASQSGDTLHLFPKLWRIAGRGGPTSSDIAEFHSRPCFPVFCPVSLAVPRLGLRTCGISASVVCWPSQNWRNLPFKYCFTGSPLTSLMQLTHLHCVPDVCQEPKNS